MSLEINQIALHQLIKRDEQTLEVVLRDSLLEPTATVVEMMAELHRVYSAKIKPMVCSATRVNWLIACACNARVKKISWRLAARQPGVCATNWQNTRLPTAVSFCSATIATWRSSICWSPC